MSDNKEKWNKICYYLHENISTNINENIFETKVEKALEILGWNEYSGDFEIRPEFQLGSTRKSLKPDFVIKSNKTGMKLFVIEIKRPKTKLLEQNKIQLSTYMRQFKLSFGLLIGPEIQIFYDGNLNKEENAILVKKISFDRDNKDGMEFTELFTKETYSKQVIEDYAIGLFREINKEKINDEIIIKINTTNFKNKILDLVKSELSSEYNIENINSALEEYNLSFIQEKAFIEDSYIQPEKINENKNRYTSTGDIDILLSPSDQTEFKRRLLETKKATMKYYYTNGNIVDKFWDANNFTKDSNLIGNIYSKSGIRKKERIEQGIYKVEISIIT